MDSFVVMPCDENDILSFRVPDDFMLNSHRMMRVISKSFVTGLLAMNDLEIDHTYNISGTIIEQIQKTAQKILYFVFHLRTTQMQNLKSVV